MLFLVVGFVWYRISDFMCNLHCTLIQSLAATWNKTSLSLSLYMVINYVASVNDPSVHWTTVFPLWFRTRLGKRVVAYAGPFACRTNFLRKTFALNNRFEITPKTFIFRQVFSGFRPIITVLQFLLLLKSRRLCSRLQSALFFGQTRDVVHTEMWRWRPALRYSRSADTCEQHCDEETDGRTTAAYLEHHDDVITWHSTSAVDDISVRISIIEQQSSSTAHTHTSQLSAHSTHLVAHHMYVYIYIYIYIYIYRAVQKRKHMSRLSTRRLTSDPHRQSINQLVNVELQRPKKSAP